MMAEYSRDVTALAHTEAQSLLMFQRDALEVDLHQGDRTLRADTRPRQSDLLAPAEF
jgi:hypothetical protein